MEQPNRLYTSGTWTVRPGNESEFIRVWRDFATWSTAHQPGAGGAHLLQDLEAPNRFLSFGPWDSEQSVQAWRATPEFAAFTDRVRDLCESFEPRRLREVASAGER